MKKLLILLALSGLLFACGGGDKKDAEPEMENVEDQMPKEEMPKEEMESTEENMDDKKSEEMKEEDNSEEETEGSSY